jgi:integrase
LAGLAGLREKEIMRLKWEDVFRVPDHIEVSALKSKTRSRRLIEICPSLAQWLEPYRDRTGAIWRKSYDMFHIDFAGLRESISESVKIPNRRNGLRHSFVTFHYALHSDEGYTAKEAGNSPQMIHAHYKGLATKKEAEAWFAVAPDQAANVIPLASDATVEHSN